MGITYSPCEDMSEVIFYTIDGMGHTWPGGFSLLPEAWVGKTSDKLKANNVIWEFFKGHPMP
jgi:polyhydroxybutyrate depolymerase